MIPNGFIFAMFIAFVFINIYNVVQTLRTRTATRDENALKLLHSVGILHFFWGIERIMFIFIGTDDRLEWMTAVRNLIIQYELWRYVELVLFAAMGYSALLFWDSISPKDDCEDCDEEITNGVP